MDPMRLQNMAEQSPECKPIGCKAMACVNRQIDPPLCNKLLNEYRTCVDRLKIQFEADYANGLLPKDEPKRKTLGVEGQSMFMKGYNKWSGH